MLLHQHNGWASGGWMSDDLIDGKVGSGTQQQWISRNCEWSSWTGSNWNMVFVGVNHPPAGGGQLRPTRRLRRHRSFARSRFSEIDRSGNYSVRVPALRNNSSGITWHSGSTPGKSIPIGRFYIARPDVDTAATINAQLSQEVKICC